MNHRNRTCSLWMVFAILAAHFLDRGYGWVPWTFMAVHCLVYPHAVFLRARHAGDQLLAEIQNLLLDSFCFGIWAAVMGFPLWITFMLAICCSVNMAAFRAAKGVLQSLVAMATGAVLVFALGRGERFVPGTSLLVSVMCMGCMSIYLILFAHSAHIRTVVLHEMRIRLRQRQGALQRQIEAIQHEQVHLTEQANRDPLTGLYNRRYLDDSLQRELDRCAREGSALSLLLIDLDHFKRINDRHGHTTGDEVLRRISALLRQNRRSSDICCRYGGEEFLLVLPQLNLETAIELAERCRCLVAEQRWLADGQPFDVTLSIGVACSTDARTAPATLIDLADRALYRAKAEGRNRVSVSPTRPANRDTEALIANLFVA